jgi:hypothetical protein
MRAWGHAIANYRGLPVLLVILTALLAVWRLDSVPAMWWDEGWTASVARNWVTLGHYGRLLDGQWINSTLAAAFPVTAPVALSFWLFGVGVWQARIVGVAFLIGALAATYFLASRLYNRKVGLGALVLLGFVPPHPSIFPAYVARQVLGEIPMLFWLLSGYALFLMALRRPRWRPLAVLFAALCWGLGIATKQQALPFWAVSMVVPILAAALKRQPRTVGLLIAGGLIAWGVSYSLRLLTRHFLSGYHLPGSSLSGLTEVTAFVLTLSTQMTALRIMFTFGLPIVLGLAYAAMQWSRVFRQTPRVDAQAIVQLQLLALVGSWSVWFLIFSVGWHRYFFPVAFVGCVFLSALLHDLTNGFAISDMFHHVRDMVRRRRVSQQGLKLLAAIGIGALLLGLGIRSLSRFATEAGNPSLERVVHFLNTATPPDARVESYESELFFMLDRPYHHPPDQVHVELIRRAFVDPQTVVDYDPLEADPDYLVVGEFNRMTDLYMPALATGAFRRIHEDGSYEVFERVR